MFFPCLLPLADALFAADYAAARDQFLGQAQALQRQLKTPCDIRSYPLSSVDEAETTTDTLYFGSPKAKACVVLISGTHGVEGYAGSAVQSFLLAQMRQESEDLPDSIAILMVHSLNPWGMVWSRRCDAEGIDVNRNFVDFAQPLPAHSDFSRVRDIFVTNDTQARGKLAQTLAAELGSRRFQEAISGGQYHDPSLPFYGGQAPSQSRLVVEDLVQRYGLAQKDLVVIDVHTGLGPWGYGELICDHALDSPQEYFAQHLFGAAVSVPERGTSSSVPKHGLLDYAWHRIMNRNSCFLTLEFGSYDLTRLFDVIIDDHIVWAERDDTEQWQTRRMQSEQNMRAHFYPHDLAWRRGVLFQSAQVMARSLDYFRTQYAD